MSTINPTKNTSPDSDEIDLGRLLGELIDHRKVIISITAAFTVVAILYALLSTPIYQAQTLIQVEQKKGNAILNSLSQMLPDSQPQSAPEIALLQSRMILGKTVDDMNLQIKVEQRYFPLIGRGWARLTGEKKGNISLSRFFVSTDKEESEKIVLTIVNNTDYILKWNGDDITGRVGELISRPGISIKLNSIDAEPGTEFDLRYLTKLKAMNNLLDNFSVADQGKDTGMLNLKLLGDQPELITRVLDSISQNYLAQNISRQAAQDAKSLDFLNQQLPQVRSDLDKAEDKLNDYRRHRDSVDLSLEAKAVLDQIVNVDNQLNELTFREAEVSQLFTPEHPTYKALNEKKKTLKLEKEKLNKKVTSMPSTQQEILRLSRDVESGRAVYMQLLNRQQELSIAKSSAIGNVRIVDSAVTEPKPVKPKKVMVILSGFIIGFIISVGIVLIRVFLRRGITSPDELEEVGVTVYASVPLSEWLSKYNAQMLRNKVKKDEMSFLAVDNPADLAIEAIRGLRTSLHFAMLEAKNNILMISGASPNAGKSFISSNLAAIVSQTGKKVLFIDADMRKGYAHVMFGKNLEHGLSDLLSGQSPIGVKPAVVEEIGFDFISRGNIPPNPAELLMHNRFDELIAWAQKNYDLVIIDTPPILAVTDAAIIGNYAGTTLLVARFEQNTSKEILASIKRFEQSGISVKGCILNGVLKKASNYYGDGYTSYDYSYSDKK